MTKILVINPNSSQKMTNDIEASLLGQENVEVIRISAAPEVLESFADYTYAGASVLQKLSGMDLQQYSGILLACFGDPCLYALKEKVNIPVIGIAEAALSRALLMGYRFSVAAASKKAVPMMESMIRLYGLQARNAGTVSLEMEIRDFLNQKDFLYNRLCLAAKLARKKGADILILGCAGMTMIDIKKLSADADIEIIDPVLNGVSTLRAMIVDGNRISKCGLYHE